MMMTGSVKNIADSFRQAESITALRLRVVERLGVSVFCFNQPDENKPFLF
jgi:hypothetical protein